MQREPDDRGAPLLRSLRASWPPIASDDGRGYRRVPLQELRPLDALGLGLADGGEGALVATGDAQGRLAALPLVRAPAGWRVASAGDGVAEALVAALGAPRPTGSRFRLERVSSTASCSGERALGVDQTNRSVVVGEAVVVKWYTQPGSDGRRAGSLLAHLAEVGFAGVPRLHATLAWAPQEGSLPAVLAIVDEYLPGAADGWEWCTGAVVAHVTAGHPCGAGCPASFPRELGRLAGGLHLALGTPSRRIPRPVRVAERSDVPAWLEGALADLDAALAIEGQGRNLIVERQGSLRDELRALADVTTTATQPVHGDLHVGQVLRGPAGLRVIDFDGAPASQVSAGLDRQPTASDVAHLLVSLELVVEVARKRLDAGSAERLAAWARTARADLLRGYRGALADRRVGLAGGCGATALDERLIRPFMVRQLCREIRYAADTLPRWRYAPIGALLRLYPVTRP